MSMPIITRRTALTAGIAAGALAAGALSATATAFAEEESRAPQAYTPGTYVSEGQGRRGPIQVEVTFSANAIDSVSVIKHDETPSIAASALDLLPLSIVDGQTLNVDGIAGATFTSNAILNAVANCVTQAGGSPHDLEQANPAPASTSVAAGTYQGAAHGHHSDVVVEVTLGNSVIESVAIVESGETFNLSDAAANTLPQLIVDSQSFNVDTVAGATYTSRAIEAAVQDCIAQAGGIEAVRGFGTRVRTPHPQHEAQNIQVDVAVVGSGMAGIMAALAAQENGAQVAIFEKLPYWGGVSQTIRGFFGVASSDGVAGDEQGIQDFYDYGMDSWCGVMNGECAFDGYPNPSLLRVLAEKSYNATTWLRDQGATLVWSNTPYVYDYQPNYYRMDAHFEFGDESEPNVVGRNFAVLMNKFLSNGGQLYLEAPLTELLAENNTVVGLRAEGRGGSYNVTAPAVILCAGGFGASEAMTERYAPAFKGETIYNATLSSNTGDGIYLAEQIGAAVYDDGFMFGQCGHTLDDDHSMIHPYQDHLTPMSCVYVNAQGLRVNSEDPIKYTPSTSYVTPGQPDFYWAVCNASVADQPINVKILDEVLSSETHYAHILEEQLAAGNERFLKADTLAELANKMEIMPNILRYTLNRYNTFCANGVDEDFAKHAEYLVPMEDGPWYAVKCIMKFFGTAGGLVTNTQANVLTADGTPITGLYSAGENSNHGIYSLFYQGARSSTHCLVMGKIAGEEASKLARGL